MITNNKVLVNNIIVFGVLTLEQLHQKMEAGECLQGILEK